MTGNSIHFGTDGRRYLNVLQLFTAAAFGWTSWQALFQVFSVSGGRPRIILSVFLMQTPSVLEAK